MRPSESTKKSFKATQKEHRSQSRGFFEVTELDQPKPVRRFLQFSRRNLSRSTRKNLKTSKPRSIRNPKEAFYSYPQKSTPPREDLKLPEEPIKSSYSEFPEKNFKTNRKPHQQIRFFSKVPKRFSVYQ
ncbi:hypothetical protein Zmor_009800 [Zophobas morio]|uniref:Uncharacterized protein n=1 Tax=Zophobas morio TaxID=2755281 RepID=A0AA38IR91_9CUCU|nr:hypothetical protein Zmor_009800 [Zophobas morio]